jgi:iron complex outermembrane receptor protein
VLAGSALVLARLAGAQLPADSARADSARTDSLRRVRADSVAARPATALAPVRVTALGGSLSPARVPYAVSLSTPTDAARVRSPIALDDALRAIPGLAVDNRYNIALGERITIRGFGARTQFGVRGVHVDVDGVPATMPDGQTTLSHVDPATVSSSEVLRGPASSLYGNSAGGVVRLRTLSPFELGDDIRLSSTVAERGTVTTRASVSGVSGSWGGEVRASSLDYRGFREHSNARDLRTGAQVVHSAVRDTVRLTVATVDYDADNPGGLTDSASVAAPRSASATNLRYRTGEKGSHRQAGVAWRHATEQWLVDASAWGLGRHLVNPIPQRIIDLQRQAAGGRIAIEHGAPGSAVSLGAGLEHGSQWDDRRSFNSLDGLRGAVQLDQAEDVESNGAFARAAVTVASAIDVLGSVRADRIRFHVNDHLVTPTDPDDGGTRTMSAVSPSLGVSWALAPRYSLYANVATAFETPTTTELANRPDGAGGINPDLAPQHTVSTEAGARAPLGSAGAATIALFDAHIRDALVPYELASAPGRQFYRNASRARQRGIEASASALLPSSVLARVAATVIDARFAATDSAAGLVAGRRIPGVAPFRADASLSAGVGGPLRAELLATVQSRAPADDANSAWAPGFTVVDGDLTLAQRAIGAVAVGASLALSNIFDRRYDTSVVPNAARGRFFEPGPPRTLTVTVELSRHRPRR